MSKELLEALNGTNRGEFKRFLDSCKGNPRIAWYPSAGEDFRDLMYLNPLYSKITPPEFPEPKSPDIFLHTDYFPWDMSRFLDTPEIYDKDGRTKVTVKSIEQLPDCNLPRDRGIVDFPQRNAASGKVVFMNVEIDSHRLGIFTAPVIYVFAENEAFCAKRILKYNAKISHVIHIRYGGGLGGGGKASGVWLENILLDVSCECFITDGHGNLQPGDELAMKLYPKLKGSTSKKPALRQIRKIDGRFWSEHGDVSWNLLL